MVQVIFVSFRLWIKRTYVQSSWVSLLLKTWTSYLSTNLSLSLPSGKIRPCSRTYLYLSTPSYRTTTQVYDVQETVYSIPTCTSVPVQYFRNVTMRIQYTSVDSQNSVLETSPNIPTKYLLSNLSCTVLWSLSILPGFCLVFLVPILLSYRPSIIPVLNLWLVYTDNLSLYLSPIKSPKELGRWLTYVEV